MAARGVSVLNVLSFVAKHKEETLRGVLQDPHTSPRAGFRRDEWLFLRRYGLLFTPSSSSILFLSSDPSCHTVDTLRFLLDEIKVPLPDFSGVSDLMRKDVVAFLAERGVTLLRA
jgi:hypothetical protein